MEAFTDALWEGACSEHHCTFTTRVQVFGVFQRHNWMCYYDASPSHFTAVEPSYGDGEHAGLQGLSCKEIINCVGVHFYNSCNFHCSSHKELLNLLASGKIAIY
jgi:hypothetical protein